MSIKAIRHSGQKVEELVAFMQDAMSFRNKYKDGHAADLAEYGVDRLTNLTDEQITQYLLQGKTPSAEELVTIRKLLSFKNRGMGGVNKAATEAPTNDEV